MKNAIRVLIVSSILFFAAYDMSGACSSGICGTDLSTVCNTFRDGVNPSDFLTQTSSSSESGCDCCGFSKTTQFIAQTDFKPSFCITQPGNYQLCGPIVFTPQANNQCAILINADDVTLCLGNFSLTRSATAGTGFTNINGICICPGRKNVTIIDGSIRNFNVGINADVTAACVGGCVSPSPISSASLLTAALPLCNTVCCTGAAGTVNSCAGTPPSIKAGSQSIEHLTIKNIDPGYNTYGIKLAGSAQNMILNVLIEWVNACHNAIAGLDVAWAQCIIVANSMFNGNMSASSAVYGVKFDHVYNGDIKCVRAECNTSQVNDAVGIKVDNSSGVRVANSITQQNVTGATVPGVLGRVAAGIQVFDSACMRIHDNRSNYNCAPNAVKDPTVGTGTPPVTTGDRTKEVKSIGIDLNNVTTLVVENNELSCNNVGIRETATNSVGGADGNNTNARSTTLYAKNNAFNNLLLGETVGGNQIPRNYQVIQLCNGGLLFGPQGAVGGPSGQNGAQTPSGSIGGLDAVTNAQPYANIDIQVKPTSRVPGF